MLVQHDVNTIQIPDGSTLEYDGSTECQPCIIVDHHHYLHLPQYAMCVVVLAQHIKSLTFGEDHLR
jgi:hypothetical protein